VRVTPVGHADLITQGVLHPARAPGAVHALTVNDESQADVQQHAHTH
jgi:hypothetical protein